MPNHDIIGSADACELLHIDRSTLTRWVGLGRIEPITRLPGPKGAYLFARADIEALATPTLQREAT